MLEFLLLKVEVNSELQPAHRERYYVTETKKQKILGILQSKLGMYVGR